MTDTLINTVLALQQALVDMVQPLTEGRSLQSYGIGSFAQYLIVVLLPVTLFVILDQWTKPRRLR